MLPSLTGGGLAMRAGMVLEALTAHYSVSLLVISLYASPDANIPEHFVRICRRSAAAFFRVGKPGLWSRLRNRNPPGLSEILREYRAIPFDVIHIFRLAMLPFTPAFTKAAAQADRRVDLDEVESALHHRIACLSRLNGDLERASSEEAEAHRSALSEQEACAAFRRIYVASQEERERLSKVCTTAPIAVLPNGVRLPDPLPPPPPDQPFCFLFAGTLGYYPNEDAVLHLCREIVPRIRQTTSVPFEIAIVGSGASQRIRDAVLQAGLQLTGRVADMQPYYRRAGAVIVPLRAGAGTRIKILEAWGYRRPVVTTAVGIEGIPGRDGIHALIADTPDSFAAGCVRLMEDPELARSLAANAYALVSESFSLAAMQKAIAAPDGQIH